MVIRIALMLGMIMGPLAIGAELRVDCSQEIGRIRPLNGSNSGPIHDGGMVDLSAYHREIGIPFTRLHDCHWPNPDVVDMHVVFPDLKADPQRPESYNFSRTDDYIQSVLNVGSQVVYRLGESIEHTKKRYYVHPPADYEKWAAACVGIIRHYNDGWANGFHHNIRYWEIWNEPENRPAMWSGSDEDYLRLYEVSAKAIKANFPQVKVGGPSFGYSGKLNGGRFEPSEFLVRFLERCKSRSVPLDFLSWHLYTDDPAECMARARGIRQTLDAAGFTKTESHFNEWNYLPDRDWGPMMLGGQGRARERFYQRMGGAEGAAFAACVLSNLQDTPVDVANFYTAGIGGFGMFNYQGTPNKVFYAFKAFRMMLDTPVRLQASGGEASRATVLAGTNAQRSEVRVLVSNLRAADGDFKLALGGVPWQGATMAEVYLVSDGKELEKVREARLEAGNVELSGQLPTPSVCLIRLTQAKGN